ncbi:sulfate adenylyltransferase [Entophlyctis helioformis]|nr:sulfate adenylyltransferase [Entophlyctis helioformis]
MANTPHGGVLTDLVARDAPLFDALLAESQTLPSIVLNDRQLCDLELILNGGFSPLDGFLSLPDYSSVVSSMRLANGTLWPIPVTLDVSEQQIHDAALQPGARVVLRNPQDLRPLAILTVRDLYRPDKALEAAAVFGKNDSAHPAVHYLHSTAGSVYVGGPLQAIALPAHYDYVEHRFTPRELREWFQKLKWTRVVAFQTRNPMHRAHRELTVRAAREHKCNVLIHPVVGVTKPGDIDHYTRVRVYKALLPKYPQGMAALSLLPLAMRMGGPREALWHAIIRKNFGKDHAGPGKDSQGNDFYGPYDAQELVEQYKSELDIQVVPFQMVSYVPETDEYIPADQVPQGVRTLNISGTELRRALKTGGAIPDWFTYPEVQSILRSVHPPRSKQGFAVVVAGPSDYFRGTIGRVLETVLNQSGQRPVTLLSPDGVLGNTSTTGDDDASASVERLAFVAAEIAGAGGAVVVAVDLPTEKARQTVIKAVEKRGGGVITAYISDEDGPDSAADLDAAAVTPSKQHATPLDSRTAVSRVGSSVSIGTLSDSSASTTTATANDTVGAQPGRKTVFEAPARAQVKALARTSVAQAVHEIVLELERDGFVGER